MLVAILIPSVAMAQSQAPLDLGCAETFAVLAGSTVTSTGFSVISGNVGLSPGSATVGFPPAIVVNGALHINDALANSGQGCLTIAYNDAAGRTPVPTGPFLNPGSANIGGLTLVAGLYKFTSTASITGSNVTLTGGANDVWIFQIASNLVVGNGVHVVLSGGAQASNIFWQVGTSATNGTTPNMKRRILADQSISLNTGAVLDGRALARIGAVTFDENAVTKPVLVTNAPRVVSTIPSDTATLVPIRQTLTATFSEMMDPSTINGKTFILKQGTNNVPGAVSYNGLVGAFDPTDDLSFSTMYTATMTIGAKNLAGDALARDYVWSFRTGAAPDTTAPKIRSTLPANNAIDVPVNQRLAATFSEVMAPVSITPTTFVLRKGQTQIPGTIVYAGLTATFKPSVTLTSDTTYTATITSGVMDLAGNHMTTDYVWSFETDVSVDLTAPTVLSTIPVNFASGVGINKSITATFSEVMDPWTITSTSFLLRSGGVSVTGATTYADSTATFTPSSHLATNTMYTATITMKAADLAGNNLAMDYDWTFTTGAALPSPLPIDLDCANDFTVLAGSTVTSTGNTIIHGDVGLSPGSQVVGFPPGQVLDGSIHINDALANNAQLCLTIAYNDAAGRTLNAIIVSDGELGGKTLAPGLYRSAPGSFGITNSDLTLDAQGDVNAVWIFQMPSSTLTVGNGRQVILAGGADAGNVFWQVGTAATIGTTAAMAGTIMADQSIALNTGATLHGRALARIAEVTFDGNTVVRPDIILSVRNDMVPSEFTLSQNFPNPFNPLTQIEYGIAKPSMVTLRVYSALGVEVATLVHSYQDAGNYVVSFNTNESTPQLTSGVYVYRLEVGTHTSMSRKLILLK
jgi:hypothetical protein